MEQHLGDIVVFAQVVDAGSFTAAAKLLGRPKSTVSRRISRLEDRLGVRLLHRTTRKLNLTDAGRLYYERSARIVADLDEADRLVSELQSTPRGKLRITAPGDLGGQITALCLEFLDAYPDVQIDLEFTDRYVNLVEERFDLAVRAGNLADSTLIAKKLGESYWRIVASPAYLEKHGRPQAPQALKDHNCVVFSPKSSNATWTLRAGKDSMPVRIKGRLAVNSLEGVKRAVLEGFGIAQLPSPSCQNEIDSGQLEVLLPDACLPASPMWAVYPSSRHLAPKVNAFISFLSENIHRTGLT